MRVLLSSAFCDDPCVNREYDRDKRAQVLLNGHWIFSFSGIYLESNVEGHNVGVNNF